VLDRHGNLFFFFFYKWLIEFPLFIESSNNLNPRHERRGCKGRLALDPPKETSPKRLRTVLMFLLWDLAYFERRFFSNGPFLGLPAQVNPLVILFAKLRRHPLSEIVLIFYFFL